MLKPGRIKELSFFIQIRQNILVCILNKLSCISSFLRQLTLSVNKLKEGQVISSSHLGIIFTKGRSDVNDTGTIGHSDIGVTGYIMAFFVLLCCHLT